MKTCHTKSSLLPCEWMDQEKYSTVCIVIACIIDTTQTTSTLINGDFVCALIIKYPQALPQVCT